MISCLTINKLTTNNKNKPLGQTKKASSFGSSVGFKIGVVTRGPN